MADGGYEEITYEQAVKAPPPVAVPDPLAETITLPPWEPGTGPPVDVINPEFAASTAARERVEVHDENDERGTVDLEGQTKAQLLEFASASKIGTLSDKMTKVEMIEALHKAGVE
jgi:hypothetical protein